MINRSHKANVVQGHGITQRQGRLFRLVIIIQCAVLLIKGVIGIAQISLVTDKQRLVMKQFVILVHHLVTRQGLLIHSLFEQKRTHVGRGTAAQENGPPVLQIFGKHLQHLLVIVHCLQGITQVFISTARVMICLGSKILVRMVLIIMKHGKNDAVILGKLIYHEVCLHTQELVMHPKLFPLTFHLFLHGFQYGPHTVRMLHY